MAVVSDFTTIVDDRFEIVGNIEKKFNFDTGGRHAPGDAYIILMVSGLIGVNENAEVILNGTVVGNIFNDKGGPKDRWRTQMIHTRGIRLKNGMNELKLTPVGEQYIVTNVYCHFKQDV